MYTLAPDEKATTVMIYSHNALIRGDLVTKQIVRVNIWLRTQGVPEYIHVFKPQVVVFGGTPPKSFSYNEIFVPAVQIIGFHIAPPASEPLDYDADEANRKMEEVRLLLGTFELKGKARISSQTDLATGLQVARAAWMSIYDAEVVNPYLPQMPAIQVPMLLVNPSQVNFGV